MTARIDAPWLTASEVRSVFAALGEQALFVGGCVRNTVLGEPVSDLDLSTPLLPGEVTRRIEAAGLKAIPTGIEHGTITAVADGRPFEITTYRADVETDGRRAVVRFSTDIAEDAVRRDFTMNALYARPDGTLVDPLGGLEDTLARRVRFILDPAQRIREDALRILRFFRFNAWYGHGIDAEGLAACAEMAERTETLARERIGAEMRKLLAAPDPGPAVATMAASGVMMRCLPGAVAEALPPLIHREAETGSPPDWLTRLAALGPEDAETALRLSKAEARALAAARSVLDTDATIAASAAAFGAEAARRGHLIRSASQPADWAEVLAEIARAGATPFPLTAADLIAAGLKPGPDLGQAMARARAAWLASDLRLDKPELMVEALYRSI